MAWFSVELLLIVVNIVITVLSLLVVGGFFKQLPNVLSSSLEGFVKQFQESLLDPNVKRAFSILQTQSVDSRMEKADVEKINQFMMDQNPILAQVSEMIGIPPDRLMKYAQMLQGGPSNSPIGQLLGQFMPGSTPGNNGQMTRKQVPTV